MSPQRELGGAPNRTFHHQPASLTPQLALGAHEVLNDRIDAGNANLLISDQILKCAIEKYYPMSPQRELGGATNRTILHQAASLTPQLALGAQQYKCIATQFQFNQKRPARQNKGIELMLISDLVRRVEMLRGFSVWPDHDFNVEQPKFQWNLSRLYNRLHKGAFE